MAGQEAARSGRRNGGRPAGLTKEALEVAGTVKILYDSGERSDNDLQKVWASVEHMLPVHRNSQGKGKTGINTK